MVDSKVNCFIQCRLSSSRLPQKALLDLNGANVIERVYERVCLAKSIDNVIVIIPDNEPELTEFLLNAGIPFFKGSPDDLVNRYYEASKIFPSENIVRITADCPFIDPAVIDEVIEVHVVNKNDFTTNAWIGQETFPDGMDCAVITKKMIKYLEDHTLDKTDREHVVTYIMANKEFYKTQHIKSVVNYNEYRLTLDYIEDYFVLSQLAGELFSNDQIFTDYYYGTKVNDFSMTRIIDILSENPILKNMNSMHKRNGAINE